MESQTKGIEGEASNTGEESREAEAREEVPVAENGCYIGAPHDLAPMASAGWAYS